MKAVVYVRLKRDVLDPQGVVVRRALGELGFTGVTDVRVGKLIEIEVAALDAEELEARVRRAADELLANPVTEDYEVVVVGVGAAGGTA